MYEHDENNFLKGHKAYLRNKSCPFKNPFKKMRNIRFIFLFVHLFWVGCSLNAQKVLGMDEYVVLDSVQPSKELLRIIDSKEFQEYFPVFESKNDRYCILFQFSVSPDKNVFPVSIYPVCCHIPEKSDRYFCYRGRDFLLSGNIPNGLCSKRSNCKYRIRPPHTFECNDLAVGVYNNRERKFGKIVYKEDDFVYNVAESMPEYPGGFDKMLQFIQQKLATKMSKGKVHALIKFIVEKDGSLTNFEVVRNETKADEKILIGIAKEMPKWTPAKMGKKIVRSYFTIPIMRK